MNIERNYGYIKDKKDERDHLVKFTDEHVVAYRLSKGKQPKVKTSLDLRKNVKLPESWADINQEKLGSCTSQAIAFAYGFDEVKQTNAEVFMPSRLFIYYNERMMEGTVNEDAGAEIRDGIKSINKFGACTEHRWVYDISKFTVKPPADVYTDAKLAKAVKYARIDFSSDKTIDDRVAHLKKALQSGFPFVFGFKVYASFESDTVTKTGIVPMPTKGEKLLGGHAVCAIGYDDDKGAFIVKNSWGKDWGINGCFYMPYHYVADLDQADDFWVVKRVTDPNNIPDFTPEDINPEIINVKGKGYGGYCDLL